MAPQRASKSKRGKMGKIKQQTINSRIDFFCYAFRNILLAGLPLTIISGLVLSHLSIHSSATSSGTDNFTVNIFTACTISSTVNSEHTINANIGTYNPDVGKTTITTLCNDGNGYSIYANGFSNNEEGNNKLINSTYPQYSIDTGLATSGLTSAWAMKLNNIENDPSPTPPSIDSSYNDAYGLVPNVWTKVASRQSGTTDMSEGSSFTTTYSVYASSSQYNGTYNGQVKYVLLHPYKNDSTITTVPTFEESFAISGKEKVSINGEDYYKMQDMNSLICGRVSNANETPIIQLVDIRDNKIYWIAKLADDNCWMTQNLDLDLDSTAIAGSDNALTSENTDLNTYSSTGGAYSPAGGYSQDASGKITWVPVRSTITTLSAEGFPNTTAANSTSYSYDPGDKYYSPAASGYDGNNGTAETLAQCEARGYTDCEHYSAGNYYNWSASIASNDTSTLTSNNPGATNSICPKGWRLPKTASNEFKNLTDAYGITSSNALNLRNSPLYFVRSGGVSGGSLGSPGRFGCYWSSTVDGGSDAYRIVFGSGLLDPVNRRIKSDGQSVRCLAE